MRQLTITIFLIVTALCQSSFASDEIVIGNGSSLLTMKPGTASIVAELECEKAGAISMDIPVIADMLSPAKAKIKGVPNIKIEDVTHNNVVQPARATTR